MSHGTRNVLSVLGVRPSWLVNSLPRRMKNLIVSSVLGIYMPRNALDALNLSQVLEAVSMSPSKISIGITAALIAPVAHVPWLGKDLFQIMRTFCVVTATVTYKLLGSASYICTSVYPIICQEST